MRNVGGTAPPSGLPAISPTRGEISLYAGFANIRRCGKSGALKLPSPPIGEMAGRPEGGAKERQPG
ncbi:propionyl-coenzyme A carboxylase alpha polypeptide [Mesorhizobium sp. M1D.F.Ca.ET.184.01.1.1]|nr:propionyl-coenzyme A carboxylase alpha polypeptide [Mesorhizobium sp. M1D.F.Ca.ET.231.01.1.1]TGP30560.1 propionyl-coenzyme A carboxylase alpha polypeptide [Mesorhizobium sp. M1D.F.Ca.ET.234.01.1.1]TGS44635.1 propionyl-coenzyme A carboxylase alpha polypeptide [Mesorhizobium sp. M1D.F.Ca.ET.184.01.1.1]TGS60675.1 propionyl-coenzyme A carboxylase alpha polypeptide [Mesorhizobium sp. M1D.F.Ca.ET.183.01.1.1]